jgi:hypothetical protein
MGSQYPRYEAMRSEAAEMGWVTRRANAKRMEVADKIVMVVTDRICADILRPGPEDAERECYVVAQELRDYGPKLKDLIVAILKVEENER